MVGMKAAIVAKCRDCIYDPLPGNGTWRAQVEACTSMACSLWPVRPLTSETQEKHRDPGASARARARAKAQGFGSTVRDKEAR